MLARLRRKFIALIMVILTLVLTVVFGFACFMEWQAGNEDAKRTLESAINFAIDAQPASEMPEAHEAPAKPNSLKAPAPQPKPPEFSSTFMKPFKDAEGAPAAEIPVSVFMLTENGFMEIEEQSSNTVATNIDITDQLAEKISEASLDTVHNDNNEFVYLKQNKGGQIYAAVSASRIFSNWQSLALILLCVEAIILTVFFLISLVFSRWALRPVEIAWNKQRKFIADASHELKTPLSIISANNAIMLDEPDMPSEDRISWLERSRTALEGMRSLLDEMLLLASNDENQANENKTDIPQKIKGGKVCSDGIHLSRIVESSVLQFESVAFERGFTFSTSIRKNVFVKGNADDLKRLLDILMDNACKYVNNGGRVEVMLDVDAYKANLEVSNTGRSIPKADIERVFDRFYRTDKSRTEHTGHGLGLSIAKSIADNMKAELYAESSDDITKFVFSTETMQEDLL